MWPWRVKMPTQNLLRLLLLMLMMRIVLTTFTTFFERQKRRFKRHSKCTYEKVPRNLCRALPFPSFGQNPKECESFPKSLKISYYLCLRWSCNFVEGKSHWQLIRSKLGFYFSSGITLDIDVFFLWHTSYISNEDKTCKNVEKNPF